MVEKALVYISCILKTNKQHISIGGEIPGGKYAKMLTVALSVGRRGSVARWFKNKVLELVSLGLNPSYTTC